MSGRGRGRGKDMGGRGTEARPPGPPTVPIPPTPNMTDMDRKGEEKAWMGTVTMLNPEKMFGFLKADNGLPKDYTGDSLFFHFDIIKNSLGKTSVLTHGSKVKFILYKAKDGDKATLERPKAFAVYLTKQQPAAKQEQATLKKGKDSKAEEAKKEKSKSSVSTGKDIKSKLASGNKQMKVCETLYKTIFFSVFSKCLSQLFYKRCQSSGILRTVVRR